MYVCICICALCDTFHLHIADPSLLLREDFTFRRVFVCQGKNIPFQKISYIFKVAKSKLLEYVANKDIFVEV